MAQDDESNPVESAGEIVNPSDDSDQMHVLNQKHAWKVEPRSAIPTAVVRCIIGFAMLAVGILGSQTVGTIFFGDGEVSEPVNTILHHAVRVMWTLLALTVVMIAVLIGMSVAVFIRGYAPARPRNKYGSFAI